MKKILLFALLTMFTTMLYAQVPNEMNYSVMLLNPTTGKVMANETAKIRLELRVGSANGDAVWGQDFEVTTDKSGMVQLTLKFTDDIDWSQGNYFLAMKVNDQEVGAPQMRSVPYAFQADRLSGIITRKELIGTWICSHNDNIWKITFNNDGTGFEGDGNSFKWILDPSGQVAILQGNGRGEILYTFRISKEQVIFDGFMKENLYTKSK
ncbi:MAG: hypothetical protein IJ552_00720 [Prevotella sp.]|nr:hypothetical protein [Prevotella sp.]